MAAMEWVKSIGISTHLAVATCLRLVLIAYGQHQDINMEVRICGELEIRFVQVKYTDVDYRVFTDGARHVYEGGSPYDRHTYRLKAEGANRICPGIHSFGRYSPLLAYLMLPNLWSASFGKLLFVMFDIFSGHLIYCILRFKSVSLVVRHIPPLQGGGHHQRAGGQAGRLLLAPQPPRNELVHKVSRCPLSGESS
jgi:phosphatidylinositol glycan class M